MSEVSKSDYVLSMCIGDEYDVGYSNETSYWAPSLSMHTVHTQLLPTFSDHSSFCNSSSSLRNFADEASSLAQSWIQCPISWQNLHLGPGRS